MIGKSTLIPMTTKMIAIALCSAWSLSVLTSRAEPVKVWSNVSEAQLPALAEVSSTMGWM